MGSKGEQPKQHDSSEPQQPKQRGTTATRSRQCQTEGCQAELTKAKGKYCSEACYVRGCAAKGEEPQRCKGVEGCQNIAVPGEQGGTLCPSCYKAWKAIGRARQGNEGRPCARKGCTSVVLGTKPPYGRYCSLTCGEESGTAKSCSECGAMAAFACSQDPRRCLQCYNAWQAGRATDLRKKAVTEGKRAAKRRKREDSS